MLPPPSSFFFSNPARSIHPLSLLNQSDVNFAESKLCEFANSPLYPPYKLQDLQSDQARFCARITFQDGRIEE